MTLRPYLAFSLYGLLFTLTLLPTTAQANTITVTKAAEYNIGWRCPVSATLDPTQTAIWVLMDNCGTEPYNLRGFQVADGKALNDDTNMYSDAMSGVKASFMDAENVPLAFTPDGLLDVLYNDSDTKDTKNVHLHVDTGYATSSSLILLTKTELSRLIPGFAGTPDATVYNNQHTLAAVADKTRFHIVDLRAGKDMLQIEMLPGTFGAYPSFSVDSSKLYIAALNHPDDINDNTAALKIYSLPDGKLTQTYAVPSSRLWISPNERYAALQPDDNELAVVELATGQISQPLQIPEAPRAVSICVNTGLPIGGDVKYQTKGHLPLMDLVWLPDSSGFLTVNSYEGDGGESNGGVCIFDTSRLRRYSLQTGS